MMKNRKKETFLVLIRINSKSVERGGDCMKKLIVLFVVAIFMLAACQSADLSLTEIQNVPEKVQDHIDSTLQLQSINEEDGIYIVFHASGDVMAKLDMRDDTVILKFDVDETEEDMVVKQYVYYLTTDADYGTIDVYVDGKSKAFDSVTVI